MSIEPSTRTTTDSDWGILARSVFWVCQSWFVTGTALILIGMQGGNRYVELATAIVTSVITVYLLLRQVEGLIEQKLE